MTSNDLKTLVHRVRDSFKIRRQSLSTVDCLVEFSHADFMEVNDSLTVRIGELMEADKGIRCGWDGLSANGQQWAEYLFLAYGTAAEKKRVRKVSRDTVKAFTASIPG